MVRSSSLLFYCLIGSAAGKLDSGEIVGIAGGATAGVGLLGATIGAALDKSGAPAPAPGPAPVTEAPGAVLFATCGEYSCTTENWVKKNITGIEKMPYPSEATCCEAACGVAGKPACQQFGVVEPEANAKKAGSSASSAGSFDESSGSSATSFNSSSDSFGSGSNGSNGSDKGLLWLIPLLLCLCCLIPLLLWFCMSGQKKKTKKKAVPPQTKDALLPSSEPMATVAFDTNNDGNANFLVTGVDRNRDGIPDALQDESYVMDEVAVGVDTSGDGVANYNVQGVDILRNGMPDFSRQQFMSAMPITAAQPVYGTYAQPTYGYTPMNVAQPGYVV